MTFSALHRRLLAGLCVLPLACAPCAFAQDKPITSSDQIQSEDDLARLVDALGAQAGAPKAEAEAEPSLGAVTAEMVPATVAPGEKFDLIVHVAVKAGAHTFPDAAQTKAGPSTVQIGSAAGLRFAAPQWPKAQREKNVMGEMEAVYKGEVLIRIPGTAPDKAGAYAVKGAFTGRYCDDKDHCFQARDYPFEAVLTVAAAEPKPAPQPEPKPEPKVEPKAETPSALVDGLGANWGLPVSTDLVVKAEAEPLHVAPGGTCELRVHLTPPKGLHTYPDKAQNAESTTEFTLAPHKGLAFGKPMWPKAETWESAQTGKAQVYLNTATLRVTVVADRDLAPGTHVIKGVVKAQTCDEKNCFEYKDYPFEATVTVDPAAPVTGPAVAGNPPADAPKTLEKIPFDLPWGKVEVDPNTAAGLAQLLLLAGLGGFILNFMPCVLPVIPIKILGLAQAAGTRGKRLLLGGLMSAGVMTLWLAMGAVLAFTRFFTGTSDLFGYPFVNLGLGLFIILMAFVATGFVPLRLPQFVYRINPRHDSLAGSFSFGVMTGVFALPCIGPFMGAASGAVLKAGDPRFILAVFAAIGIGMALPYFVLAANPKWVDKLPKAGPGSDVMKSFLGWLMLAGGVYFVQAAIVQWTQPDSYFWERAGVMLAFVLIAVAGLALAVGCAKLLKGGAKRLAPAVFLLLGVAIAGFGAWQAKVEATADHLFLRMTRESTLPLGQGKIVVVDFRSINCPNCDYNEKNVFYTPAGRALLGIAPPKDQTEPSPVPVARDVVAYQANIDYTFRGEALNKAFLKRVSGNTGVPFLVVYDAKGRQVETINGTLTTDQLRQAIEKARQAK